MASRTLRAAIVGASTLLGHELAEQLNDATGAVWDLTLLDSEDAMGQMTVAGDEAMVIQPLAPGVFERMDLVFFAGHAATTRTHWREAQTSGAGIVDLSGALRDEPGAVLSAPEAVAAQIDLATTVVVPAHTAAVMLAVVATRLAKRFVVGTLAATVMEPASEQGKAGLDELHQQTVGLLSFQNVPTDVYDTQVAFNLATMLGAEAKVPLEAAARAIANDFAGLNGGVKLALQLVQAPVFNGYTASVFVTVEGAASAADLAEALDGGVVEASSAADFSPSNLSASAQKQLQVAVRGDAGGFWLWMAADNLLFAAQNAVASAMELVKLRPAGKPQ